MTGAVSARTVSSYHFVPFVLFLLVGVSGCFGIYTLEEKRQLFYEYYIQDSLGHSIAQITRYRLGHQTPREIRHLPNGNELYVYQLFEYRYGDDNTCALLLEVEPDTKTVVGGNAKGEGCYVIP